MSDSYLNVIDLLEKKDLKVLATVPSDFEILAEMAKRNDSSVLEIRPVGSSSVYEEVDKHEILVLLVDMEVFRQIKNGKNA